MQEKHVDILVKLDWYSEKKGGKKTIPRGQVYAANLRFEEDESLWSIVIFLQKKTPYELDKSVVELAFLFRENLEGKLVPGKRIFIYEGPEHLVAEGKILKVNE